MQKDEKTTPDRPTNNSPAPSPVVDDAFGRTMAGFSKVVDTITPWLFELGTWLFGALIAFNLVILGALLTVGPQDTAILVATAAFAIALPLDVAGFVVLRLAPDMQKVSLEDTARTAFRDVGFVEGRAEVATTTPEARQKRRARAVLGYSYTLLLITITVTLVGLAGALWHMAWWIAVLFAVMVIVSALVAVLAIGSRADPLGLTRQS